MKSDENHDEWLELLTYRLHTGVTSFEDSQREQRIRTLHFNPTESSQL